MKWLSRSPEEVVGCNGCLGYGHRSGCWLMDSSVVASDDEKGSDDA